jgi:hypothetical protein
MPNETPGEASRSPYPPPGGAEATAGDRPSNEGNAAAARKFDAPDPLCRAMRIDSLEQSTAVLTARTSWGTIAPPRDADLDLDPLAGEDELWAEEDLLLQPDAEDYFRFLRTLWIVLLLCCMFWVALAVGGVALFTAG